MKKISVKGEHRKFESIPETAHKDIEKHAKTDGNLGAEINPSNLPKVIYETEKTLRKYHHRQYTKAQVYFHELQQTAANSNSESDLHNIKLSLLTVIHNFNLDKEEASLRELHHEFLIKKTNYLDFKKYHSRPLLPVNSDGNSLQWIVLVVLFILECVINFSMMFSGGAVTRNEALAVGISQAGINIVTCYIVGRMVTGRMLFAEELAQKISYSIVLLIHAFIVVLLNANMGLFRNAIVKSQSGDTLSTEQLLQHWSWSPWDRISSLDVTAVLVIGVGIVLALVSYIDGYFSDDPYPGYGRVYRSLMDVKKRVSAKTMGIKDKWNNVIKNYKEASLSARENGISAIDRWSKSINDIEQVAEDYKELLKHLDKEYRNVINIYETTYNRFHKDAKIDLKSTTLLTLQDYDLDMVFKDVKDYFKNDTQRLNEAELKKNKFILEFEKIELEIDKINDKKIDKLNSLDECKI